MIVHIIVPNKKVSINGEWAYDQDMTSLDSNIYAIHWYGQIGEIEYTFSEKQLLQNMQLSADYYDAHSNMIDAEQAYLIAERKYGNNSGSSELINAHKKHQTAKLKFYKLQEEMRSATPPQKSNDYFVDRRFIQPIIDAASSRIKSQVILECKTQS